MNCHENKYTSKVSFIKLLIGFIVCVIELRKLMWSGDVALTYGYKPLKQVPLGGSVGRNNKINLRKVVYEDENPSSICCLNLSATSNPGKF
jgi:hypothetical protein